MIRSSVEAQDIQRRFFKDKLIEEPASCTIVSVDGRQRYFRALEDGKDVFIRHNIVSNRFNKLNRQCTEFEPTPLHYTPDVTRPFTKNDLLRSATAKEYVLGLISEEAPGAVAGTAISAGVAIAGTAALVTLTPVGSAAMAAGSLAGAKVMVGAKVAGAIASSAIANAPAAVAALPTGAQVGIVASAVVLTAENIRAQRLEEEEEVENRN